MNDFEQSIKNGVGALHYPKFEDITIGIAGAGGLGSNCARNLVRCGFKNFVIVDFDKVEGSNLNRQFFFHDQIGQEKVNALKTNLLKINPNLNITVLAQRIKRDNIINIFKTCNVVVEGFDQPEYKTMLVQELLPTKKFIVAASGLCGYGKTDNIQVHRLKPNLVIVGDLKTSTDCMAPISPKVNIAAAKQADVILEYIIKNDTIRKS